MQQKNFKVTQTVKQITKECKKNMIKEREGKWREKPMHGQYAGEMKNKTVDAELTFQWLKNGSLKGETESLIVAAQDQAIFTNYIRKRIYGENINEKCRICKQYDETVKHIITGCPILATKEYIERHNKVAAHIHYNTCKHYGINVNEQWYAHEPKNVETNEKVTILWDTQIHTDRHIPANKPDIIIKDIAQKTCYIIDIAIPSDTSINQKEAEKKLKYRDLQIEIQKMWKMKCIIIPIIIGATGTLLKNFGENIKKIPGNEKRYTMSAIQKTTLLETARIIRRVI